MVCVLILHINTVFHSDLWNSTVWFGTHKVLKPLLFLVFCKKITGCTLLNRSRNFQSSPVNDQVTRTVFIRLKKSVKGKGKGHKRSFARRRGKVTKHYFVTFYISALEITLLLTYLLTYLLTTLFWCL